MPVSYDLGTAQGKVVIDYDGKGIPQASQDMEKLGSQADKTGTRVGNANQALTQVGRAGLIAGAAVVAGFAVAINSAADFEFQMSAIQAVSGATADEMKLVSAAALRIGKDTKYSASEAGVAMEELVKAGIPVADVLNGAADAVVALAAAGGVDLPTAATIAANAMNQFGIKAEGLVHVTDLIAGAANASAIDMNEFAYSMSQVGAVAKLTGLSFDDTALAIAAMGNAGIKGSDAGTSLKQVLLNLNPTTKRQKDLMKELGIVTEDGANAFYDAGGKLKSLAGISDVLNNSLAGMTDQQKTATLEILFGSDAIRGAAVIAGEGSAKLNELAESMGKISAADVAKTRMDNFKGSIEQMRGALETAGIQVGQIFLPVVRKLIDGIGAALDWFISLSDGIKTTIATLALVGGVVAGLLGAVALGAAAFNSFAGAMMVATGATTLFGKAGAFAATKVKLLAVAQGILNTVMKANPILLIVSLIAGLIAAIVTMTGSWERVGRVFAPIGKAMSGIMEDMAPVGEKLAGVFAKVAETLASALLPIVDTLVDSVLPPLVDLFMALMPVISLVADVLGKLLVPAMGLLVPLIAIAATTFGVFLKILGPIVDIIAAILIPILEGLTWVLERVSEGLDFMGKAMQKWFETEGPKILTNFGKAWDIVYNQYIKPFWDKFMEVAGPVIDWFNNEALPRIETALSRIPGILEGIGKSWAEGWEALKTAASPIIDWINETAIPQVEKSIGNIGIALGNIAAGSETAWTNVQTNTAAFVAWWDENVAPKIAPGLETIRGKMAEVKDAFADAWLRIQEAVQPIIEKLTTEVFPRLLEVYTTLRDKIVEVRDRFSEAWQGMLDKLAPIVEAMQPLIQAVLDLFNKFFDLDGDTPEGKSSKVKRSWDLVALAVQAVVTPIEVALNIIIFMVDRLVGTFENMLAAVQFVMDMVRGTIQTATGIIRGIFTGDWSQFPGIVKAAFDRLPQPVRDAVSTIGSVLSTVGNTVRSVFANAGNWLWSAGRSIIDGLIGGIRSAIGGITSVLQGVTKMIPDWKGPAEVDKKLLVENGSLIMQGLINGMRSEIGSLQKFLGGVTVGIPSEFESEVRGMISRSDTAVGPSGESKVFNYYASPGSGQLSGQEELFTAMKRSKVVVPGWAN